MKVAIVVITSDLRVADFVREKTHGIIPSPLRGKFAELSCIFGVTSFIVDNRDLSRLRSHLDAVAKSTDGVIVLFDTGCGVFPASYLDALFVVSFDGTQVGGSVQNFLGRIFSRALKNFKTYFERFRQLKYQQLLLLPLENFRAEELRLLRALLRDTMAEDFANELDRHLSDLYNRRTPRSDYNSNPRVHLKDDREHYYQYGHERHGHAETGPPHNEVCQLNGRLRFGLGYDQTRHYNLTNEINWISARLSDCHQTQKDFGPQTHVNIFPNGNC